MFYISSFRMFLSLDYTTFVFNPGMLLLWGSLSFSMSELVFFFCFLTTFGPFLLYEEEAFFYFNTRLKTISIFIHNISKCSHQQVQSVVTFIPFFHVWAAERVLDICFSNTQPHPLFLFYIQTIGSI